MYYNYNLNITKLVINHYIHYNSTINLIHPVIH